MLTLLIMGLGIVNLFMLFRLWRDGRTRRRPLRNQRDTLSPLAHARARRRRS